MQKGQGALEYLLLIGGAVLVAVIVITLLLGIAEEGGASATATSTAASDLIAQKRAEIFGINQTGLIGHWSFEGGSLEDSSPLGNDGIAFGGIDCTGDPGKIGGGCTFGVLGQYVNIAAVNDYDNPTRGTVAAWVHPTATGSNRYVVNGYQNSRTYLKWDDGNLWACMSNPSICIELERSAPLDEWQHVALTWENGDTLKGYYNGQLVEPQAFTPTADSGGFKIGSQGFGKEFLGSIDEVVIYNRALSASEIATLAS